MDVEPVRRGSAPLEMARKKSIPTVTPHPAVEIKSEVPPTALKKKPRTLKDIISLFDDAPATTDPLTKRAIDVLKKKEKLRKRKKKTREEAEDRLHEVTSGGVSPSGETRTRGGKVIHPKP